MEVGDLINVDLDVNLSVGVKRIKELDIECYFVGMYGGVNPKIFEYNEDMQDEEEFYSKEEIAEQIWDYINDNLGGIVSFKKSKE